MPRRGFAALLVLISGLAVGAEQASQEDLERLKGRIDSVQSELGEFKDRRSDLSSSLKRAEVSIGELRAQLGEVRTNLEHYRTELARLRKRRDRLQEKKHHQQQAIAEQIRAAYGLGQEKKIKVLLNQENPQTLSRILTYYDYFNEARSEQLNDYTRLLDELADIEPEIAKKTQQLQSVRDRLVQRKKSLEQAQARREKALEQLEASIDSRSDKLKRLRREREELEELVYAVEETIADMKIPSDYQPFARARGKMPWPVDGDLVHNFGSPNASTGMRWRGVTIDGESGERIRAIHHGRVVFADWFRGKGLLIIIDHGNGFMSLYAHNQSLLRETGDWVAAGEVIATLGNSGGQRRNALYFEIRHKGEPTDPGRWCRSRG